MNFQDLQIFLHLADTQNLQKPLRKIICRRLRFHARFNEMEEELEQSLFIRDNRQVRLTEQGERFSAICESRMAKLATV